ncbi:MAG: bifunctional 3-deoxy-7-phosphoheptulonate synthase/chorismate mutase type II [Bdellovibrio sp.]
MSIVALNKWLPNLKRPLVVAGPCSAESEEQMLQTAKELVQIEDVRIFRAGIWKPRTRPGTFEGHGEKALQWLEKVKNETKLLTATEVANASHIELALKYNVDILWIGARTTVNPFSVQEIADSLRGTNIPVMIKNPINADLALWLGAIERLEAVGLKKLVVIHRGFSTFEKTKYRNEPMWKIPIELKRRLPDMPMICDPSHITGRRDMILEVAQKALDIDMDGVMIETHPAPELALSDADQQVTPSALHQIIKSLQLRTEFSSDRNFETELETLRSKIDRIDQELIDILANRMKVVQNIGELKKKNDVTAFQVHRMDQMLKAREEAAQKLGLSKKYIDELFNIIHDESVRRQTTILNSFHEDPK